MWALVKHYGLVFMISIYDRAFIIHMHDDF